MRMVRAVVLVLGLCVFLQGDLTHAGDWPLYRGPNQDGISPEKVVVQWSGKGPKVVWKAPTNHGFSSFAISNGKGYTLVVRNSAEVCLALDAATGKELWTAESQPQHTQGRRPRRGQRPSLHTHRKWRQGLRLHP